MKKQRLTPRERQIRNGRIVIAVLLAIAVVCFFRMTTGKHFDKDIAGMDKTIRYEVVNLRSKPSVGSKKIDQYPQGTVVTLTGYTYRHFDGDHDSPAEWVEIEYGGSDTAWVASESIDWSDQW